MSRKFLDFGKIILYLIPMAEKTNTLKGQQSVLLVYQLLIKHGLSVRIMPTGGVKSPFDLLVNGLHVEVKVSPLGKDGYWAFNIHRHGILDESSVHAYVFRLENVPGFRYAIHLVVPSPIGQKTVKISLRSLITRYGRYFNRFDLVGGEDKSKGKMCSRGPDGTD